MTTFSLLQSFKKSQRHILYFTKQKVKLHISSKNLLAPSYVIPRAFQSSASLPEPKKGYKTSLLGIGLASVTIGSYYYFQYSTSAEGDVYLEPVKNDHNYILQETPPSPKIAREIINPIDQSGLKITLYQYQTCPFCCKVRAYLDYYGFSYEIVEVNSITRKETKWTSYRKVPFLIVQQEGCKEILHLKESSLIISALHSFILNKEKPLSEFMNFYPAGEMVKDGKKRLEITNKYYITREKVPSHLTEKDLMTEMKWRKWVDDVYVHVLSPNIYRTPQEALESFSWFAKVGNWNDMFSKFEIFTITYLGAAVMYLIGKNLKKKYNLDKDVRKSFYDSTNHFLKHLQKRHTTFLGGDQPNLADLDIYGVLTAVEGCQAFTDLQDNTAINKWYQDMKAAVTLHKGSLSKID